MIRLQISFYLKLFFLCIPIFINGQRIRFYSSEHGLPNSLIHKVSQDNLGYIWIATDNGASYFDGMRFTTFRHDPDKPGSLSNDGVKIVYTDSRGVTWVGTSNGLQIYDRENNVFRKFSLQYPSFKATPYISSIVEHKEYGKLLVSVAGFGIMVYNVESHKIDLETTNQLKDLFNTSYLGKLFLDNKGAIWSYSEQGDFYKLDFRNRVIDKFSWSQELKEQRKKIIVSAITEDPISQNIIIGTYNQGIFIYDRSEGLIRRPKGKLSSKYRIRALLAETKMRNGHELNIWVGTEDSGLKKFNRDSEDIIQPDFQYAPIDLENCKVHSLMEDAQGNIWAGIYQKGLLILPRTTNEFEYIKLSAAEGSMSVNIACVTSATPGDNGDLWVGTDGGGLFNILKDGTKIRYTSENCPLPNNAILTVTADRRGTLWISTYMGGITTFHPGKGFQIYSNSPELQKVFCTLYDPANDKLYLGTMGNGVKVFSFRDNTLEDFPENDMLLWVNSLCLDNSGNLWIGQTEGISCYNTETMKELYPEINLKLKGTTINTSLKDRNGSLWFGSSDGLFHFEPEIQKLGLYSKNEGLSSNLVFSIQQDTTGILWISTINGLSRFDPHTGIFKNFHAYDGLQDNEFRMNASCRDRNGKMYFGGINGISAFYPERINGEERLRSRIYFSQLTVLNQKINYSEDLGKKNILDRHISRASQIRLKKNQNVFSLEFAVLEYANPQKVVYGYMLEGFDNEWRYTDSNHRLATYTNLPDGLYVFKVKAFFEGSSEYQGAVSTAINIRILSPWYKSFWAFMIYLALLGLLIWMFLNFIRRRKIRIQEHKELEKKEMKLRMFTDLTHELRTPFTLVMNPLKSMQEAETDTKRKELFNLIHRNILRILRLLNQIMDIRKIDNQQLKMNFQKTDLIFFIQDIMKSFEQLAIMRNIDFRLISNFEFLDVWVDRANFDKVLFNILSNAFKFTPEHGFILISLDRFRNRPNEGLPHTSTDYIELSIENSGSKLDDHEAELIFDRFYQGSSNTMGSGSGIGLHLVKMIINLHYGEIKAINTEKGVAFILRIPLANKHLSQEEMSSSETNAQIDTRFRQIPETDFVELLQTKDNQTPSKKSKSKRNLVFVDDDADLGSYVRMELSDRYNVEVCNKASEAWKVISSSAPDAIIIDLIMPEEDGISLCRKIRKNPETNHLPVIILTSQTDEESERDCIETGADHFLTKPVSLKLLKSTIAQAIQTRELIRNKYQSDIKQDFDRIKVSSPDSRLVTKVIETIRENIENSEFSVDDLSREVGLSRVHLNRKLKENINISPSNLIKSMRLKQAAYLLIHNKVNISDVAYKVGFSSHSYFSNNFKDYFGMAPTEFVTKYTELEDKESMNRLFNS